LTFIKFALARFALSSRLAGCEKQLSNSETVAANPNISCGLAYLQADVTNDLLPNANFTKKPLKVGSPRGWIAKLAQRLGPIPRAAPTFISGSRILGLLCTGPGFLTQRTAFD
jgi:hypothetical protein